LAAIRIGADPRKYDFDPPIPKSRRYDVVEIEHSVSMTHLARMARTTVAELSELNPALTRGVTPPGRQGYALRIPPGRGERFMVAYERWLDRQYAKAVEDVEPGPIADRVRRGDNPTLIAQRLGVSVPELMYVNGWTNPRRLIPGQPVRVPRPKKFQSMGRVGAGARKLDLAVNEPEDTSQVD
jgi:membrane-bound lytic murein transglycosylase D